MNFGMNNINLITSPKNNKNKRNKAATKIQALAKGRKTRKNTTALKYIRPFFSESAFRQFQSIIDELNKVTPETVGLGKVIGESIDELNTRKDVKNVLKNELNARLKRG